MVQSILSVLNRTSSILFFCAWVISFHGFSQEDILQSHDSTYLPFNRISITSGMAIVPVNPEDIFHENNIYWTLGLHVFNIDRRIGWDIALYQIHDRLITDQRGIIIPNQNGEQISGRDYLIKQSTLGINIGPNIRLLQHTYISVLLGYEFQSFTDIRVVDNRLLTYGEAKDRLFSGQLNVYQIIDAFVFSAGVLFPDNTNGSYALQLGVGYSWPSN